MLEVTFLYTFPRPKVPHWQTDSKANVDAALRK